ncbi:MAG: enoyl-CoA hydratase-related protein [Gammaproteobacteria bacterium]|nr:enoyl-CoA hydratase-related protein [Gammaproteobacteria bacterium]MDH4314619.1 enoyl-CoA hydratase-related protein [Gammaproteobacteria bacterium]MDH5212855.1 enoyl-CoA hydratase-related protein [Gammaproteobacteria bacterium]MDH5502218.1 enoyl-CoA hydratase-related protein [Gammaproteobacteria bacterium]
MSDYETVKYKQHAAVALITLHRPDSMNAFNTAMRRDLTSALVRAASSASVRAVVLTGEGRSFSAGADLKDGLGNEQSIQQTLQTEYRPALDCIASMSQPVIAAVGGSAAGIGMSYALACDLLVMADNAFLLSPFSTISLVPDGGLNFMLVQQLGYKRAFQLSAEAERISAERCVELGLANRAVPAASLVDEAMKWAHSLAERAPLSLAATKKAMRHAASGSWASTFDVEASMQDKLKLSQDCAEGVTAFFEKRKANFSGL